MGAGLELLDLSILVVQNPADRSDRSIMHLQMIGYLF